MKSIALLAAAVLLAGCGGARGPTNVAHFARGVGLATASETVEKTHRVLALHQFEIEQEEGPPSIMIDTRWRDRMPFDDERMLGIEMAQVRVQVRARPRSTTSAMGEVYTVDMSVLQRVRMAGSQTWTQATITQQAGAHAARIAQDLRELLDVGVRRF